ncbi:N,N-dimethylformamidase beta subunit family domain-containing protein [Nocardia sp. BMG51109]|uniref:N,N-dimethylformamidase beta subunit family domain-containing protein n=1 Tax=Nocardia sp. BMG51109 TaxID=1056816 RepID=UPI0004668BFF|nr:N,N-dimethylformamidase beta subunit family domain-containing protein [Nocardia sp. BMG51109]
MTRLTGYADKLSVKNGESITFFVNAPRGRYDCQVKRLFSVDDRPHAPGWSEQDVPSPIDGNHAGQPQEIVSGSYLVAPAPGVLDGDEGWALALAVQPSRLSREERTPVLTRAAGTADVGLYVSPSGFEFTYLESGEHTALTAKLPVECGRWYDVVLGRRVQNAGSSAVDLIIRSSPARRTGATSIRVSAVASSFEFGSGELFVAATMGAERPARLFDGKVSSPVLTRGNRSEDELDLLLTDRTPHRHRAVAAAWDFAAEPHADRVRDVSGNELHARTVNLPARAVTGPKWDGTEHDFRHYPEHYDAIHFHHEDLEDARWQPSLELTIPEGWDSGAYVAALTDAESTEYVPFYVRPRIASGDVLFLAPTNTYLAYGNQQYQNDAAESSLSLMKDEPIVGNSYDHYLAQHPEYGLSLYDLHADGVGVRYSSARRPILTWRPDYSAWLTSAPRHYAADFYIIGWLAHEGFTVDIATDEDLDAEGTDLLNQYKVVITGSHPEYYTGKMLDSLEEFTERGGRMMYLGGNGFYWVTSYDPERRHVIEVRRGYAGNADFRSPYGEARHSTTGEMGGIWRLRGRTPNELTGVGYTANGWSRGSGYKRAEPSAYDWVFDGIGSEETIGDFGLVLGAAGGDELDRANTAAGTPPHTVILATTTGFSDYYQPVSEEHSVFVPGQGGTKNPNVRADITVVETSSGGAVFSVGSISWAGSLAYNKYDNNVAKLTLNVLRGFLSRRSLKDSAS